MSNKKYIEDSFREKFDENSITNQGWNEPSDMVWEGIKSEITTEENPRLGYPIYMLLSGLLISLIGFGYVLNQNNKLNNKIHDIQIELLNCGNNNEEINQEPTVKSQSIEVGSLISPQTINESAPLNNTTKKVKKSDDIPKDVSYEVNKKQVKVASQNSLHSDLKNPNHLNNTFQTDRYNVSEISVSKSVNNILPSDKTERELINIKHLTYNDHLSLDIENRKIITPQNAINTPVTKMTSKSFVSISGGLLGNKLLVSGNQATALSELIDKEFADQGYSLELNYTTQINPRWSVSAGFGASYQRFITEYDITLPYEVGQEIVENGTGFIDFEHSLPTSFGFTDTQLRLRRSDADAPLEETNVNIDFDTKHELISLIAPISVDYLFADLSDGFYIGVDIVPSYIVSARSGISSVISHHSEVQSVNNDSVSEYKSLQKLNLGLGGHLGYRYAVSENNGLELGIRYLRNLGSYFETDTFSSKNHGLHLNAGYYFRF